MTRKELIDTAVLCSTDMSCKGCPYYKEDNCSDHLLLDLAKELTKTIKEEK